MKNLVSEKEDQVKLTNNETRFRCKKNNFNYFNMPNIRTTPESPANTFWQC